MDPSKGNSTKHRVIQNLHPYPLIRYPFAVDSTPSQEDAGGLIILLTVRCILVGTAIPKVCLVSNT